MMVNTIRTKVIHFKALFEKIQA